MLSSVDASWASLCARPFDGAQGDSPLLVIIRSSCLLMGYYSPLEKGWDEVFHSLLFLFTPYSRACIIQTSKNNGGGYFIFPIAFTLCF
ncbi:MAG: hypothetical protein JWR38_5669 [Mucilaginibacter sp.]|nr:hypothetical protein [Mucilaginibacter sp.]